MQVEQQGQEKAPESLVQQQDTPATAALTSQPEAGQQDQNQQEQPQEAPQQQPSDEQQKRDADPAGAASVNLASDASAVDGGQQNQAGKETAGGEQQQQEDGNTSMDGGLGYSTPLSGDPLMIIDKSKIPRPYKCPFPNCDKAFYRLEQ